MASLVARLSFDRFATALFFVMVAGAACLMPAQNDTWWQLRAGQDIVALGRVPLVDSFSHTRAGGYWPNHEWLAQVVLYALHAAGGLPLLTLGAAAVVTAAWLIVWRLTPGSTWLRIVLSAVAIPGVVNQWSLRPQIFTLLFLALTLHLLVHRRETWLFPLFLVWANMHGAVVLGIGLVAAAALTRLLRERGVPWREIGVTAGCVLAATFTPLGMSIWTEIPESLARVRPYGIAEWRRTSPFELLVAPFWLILTAFLSLVFTLRAWRTMDRTTLLLTVGTALLIPVGLTSFRNVPPFLIVAVPALGALWTVRQPPAPARERGHPLVHAAALAVVILSVGLGVTRAWSAPANRLQWQPLSDAAIAAVQSCPGPLYNRYDDGGYLIWFAPAQKVFIDSRQDPYPQALVLEHIEIERTGRFEPTFRRHGISCVFVPTGSLVATRVAQAGWQQTYADEAWTVLVR